jgi:hypothetical protein
MFYRRDVLFPQQVSLSEVFHLPDKIRRRAAWRCHLSDGNKSRRYAPMESRRYGNDRITALWKDKARKAHE